MKRSSFIALTYYHIIYSIMYAQKLEGKKKIFIQDNYLKIDETFINKLKKLNVFDEVIVYNESKLRSELFNTLNKVDDKVTSLNTKVENKKLIDNIFNPFFSKIIDVNKDDDIYIFNIRNLIYNYIANYNSNIYVIEDGYKSLVQQEKIHIFKGNFEVLNKYINNGYVNLNLEDNKIKKIIGSNEVDEVQKGIQSKYDKNDFIDMKNNNSELYKVYLNELFELPKLKHADKSTLILTQPLARHCYCYCDEQLLLYKNIIKLALNNSEYVYIKKHPADDISYSGLCNDNVILIEGDFPTEVLTLSDYHFKNIYTFGSTAIDIMDNADNKVKLFSETKFSFKDVIEEIRKYSKKEKINFAIISDDKKIIDIIEKLNKRNSNYNYIYYEKNKHQNNIMSILELDNVNYVYYDDLNVRIKYNDLISIEKYFKNNISDIYILNRQYHYNSKEFNVDVSLRKGYISTDLFDSVQSIDTFRDTLLNNKIINNINYKVAYIRKAFISIDYNKLMNSIIDVSPVELNSKILQIIEGLNEDEYVRIVAVYEYYISMMIEHNQIVTSNQFIINDFLKLLDEDIKNELIEKLSYSLFKTKMISKTSTVNQNRKQTIEKYTKNKSITKIKKIINKFKIIIKW